MTYKIHVIHVRVDSTADQPNIKKFEDLVNQFIADPAHNILMPISTTVSTIYGSASQMFTAIVQYEEVRRF